MLGTGVMLPSISRSTMPREYMSVFGDEEPKPYCSGAAYPGVPISTVSDSFCPENCFAALKSKKHGIVITGDYDI